MRISDWSSDVCSSDLSFDGASSDGVGRVRAILGRVAPHARIDEQSAWLQPLSGLLDTLRLLGVGIVLLVALAMVGTVVLATRAALNTHRETIEVMHLMGATEIGRASCRDSVCQYV